MLFTTNHSAASQTTTAFKSALEAARANSGAATARLSDGDTAYYVAGDHGPWVVLLHGLSRPGNTWEPLANALAERGFRVLYYDAFGHGLSDRPAIRYRLDVYIRQLGQLTDKLGIDAMHLIGWSLGGTTITAFAAQHPSRVSSLTLISPALFMSHSRMSQMLRRVPGSSARIARRIGHVVDGVDLDLSRPERFPDLAARVREQMSVPGFQRAVASALVNFPSTTPRRWFAAGQHVRPVLIVWGDDDPVTPIAAAAQVLGLFPRATLRRIEGGRHAAHLDHAEIVHPAIIDHLEDCALHDQCAPQHVG